MSLENRGRTAVPGDRSRGGSPTRWLIVAVALLGACNQSDRRSSGAAAPPAAGFPIPPRVEEPTDTGWFLDFQVDTAVDIDHAHAVHPTYPEALRQAEIEGRVVAQFIVDTLGNVEMNTFRVVESSHRLFTDAVRRALPRMHFLPAKLHGHRVRQLVREPFEFNLNR